MPSLNQLAARIKLDAPSAATAGNRPRLAASLLRTSSASSNVSAAASATDSVTVIPPTSRSESPAALSISPPRSDAGTPQPDESDPLTTEKLDELNEETAAAAAKDKETKPKQKMPMGYKNIPSLDAITARLAKARTLSVDGSAKPPEAETIEDPKTPGLRIKAPEHPLEHTWTLYHDTKNKVPFTPATATVQEPPGSAHFMAPDTDEYEAGLTVIGEFDTVETFCRYFNWLKPPSKLERNSNYHIFKSGIKPMWEDEANANGGKWVLTMKNNPQLLDRCWSWLAMALVGEDLDEGDEICGAVVSLRSKVDRIQVWTRSKEDVEKINGIARKMVKLLDVSEADGIGLEFQYNNEERPTANKFLSIQAVPQSSFRTSFAGKPPGFNSPVAGPGEGPQVGGAPGAGPGGAFAGFGVGGGGVLGSGWRGKRSA
ncbi:translation initiation factor eIF4e [Trametes versicolor FP-101664 SS1]|uniref:Translation initiation factor eIF4e n=1 Tax=Trametes versicolor (strain FP-101664) TaxID=717944 RepID=R7S6X0_TRAVS|nr:translation initiation factor eIF4e [Trametes versicolor FP-101664 SS1]EIW51656.1 translation initiation factor eIF4e [Trametes versicolor FP-101664 SS1]